MKHLGLIASIFLLDATAAHAAALFAKKNPPQPQISVEEFCRRKLKRGEVVIEGTQDANPLAFGSGQQRTVGIKAGHIGAVDVASLFTLPGGRAPLIEITNWPKAELGPAPVSFNPKQLLLAPQLPTGGGASAGTIYLAVKASDPDCPQNGFKTASVPIVIDASGVPGQIAPPASSSGPAAGVATAAACPNGKCGGATASSTYAVTKGEFGETISWIGVPHSAQ